MFCRLPDKAVLYVISQLIVRFGVVPSRMGLLSEMYVYSRSMQALIRNSGVGANEHNTQEVVFAGNCSPKQLATVLFLLSVVGIC